MANNLAYTQGSGSTVATDDVGGVQFQKIKLDAGGAGASALVSAAAPLPTMLRNASGTAIGSLALATALEGILTSAGATDFFFSTANATTVQLAAAATFTGTVESIISAQAWSIILTSDQPGTLTLNEYIDAGGTRITSTKSIPISAGVPFSRCYTANGNYFRLTFQNTGGSATTTLNINTAFGVLPAVTSLGNGPISINEVNGVAPSTGEGVSGTGALRVTLASDRSSNTNPLLVGGNGANSIGKAEDAPSASGDTGVPVWAVRRDALVTSASATGDYNETACNRFGAVLSADFRTTARTYRAAANVTTVAAATDVFDFFGNAATTVVVTRVFITGIQTTAGSVDILLVKRSTANTAGTRVAMTAVTLDAADAAAGSVPGVYTANPTVGTLVGALGRRYLGVSGAAALTGPGIEYEFGTKGKGVWLSGTAQGMAINLNGATVAGGSLSVEVEWFEF